MGKEQDRDWVGEYRATAEQAYQYALTKKDPTIWASEGVLVALRCQPEYVAVSNAYVDGFYRGVPVTKCYDFGVLDDTPSEFTLEQFEAMRGILAQYDILSTNIEKRRKQLASRDHRKRR